MTKYLILILLFLAPNVWADWKPVVVSSTGNFFAIDPSAIRKDGVRRTFWVMTNYSKTLPDGANSARVKYEINCQKEIITLMHITFFSNPMLLGEIVGNVSPEPEADPIAPGSVNDRLKEFVCAR